MNQSIINEKRTSVDYLKPKRQDFQETVITDNVGHVISPEVWADRIKGHHPGAVLKKEGYVSSIVFDKAEYEKTKNAFYVVKHAHDKAMIKTMIDQAFIATTVTKTKKTEHLLQSMIPSLKKLPTNEIVEKFVNMILMLPNQTPVVA